MSRNQNIITMSNLDSNPKFLKNRLEYFFNLVGKKRFQTLGYLILKNPDHSNNKIIADYQRLNSDCWEMTTFYDRITNKGFMRYSPNAIEELVAQLKETLINSKKLNLIK